MSVLLVFLSSSQRVFRPCLREIISLILLCHLTPPAPMHQQMGMMFVRCRGGVSHSPLEHVEPSDVAAAAAAMFEYIAARAATGEID